MLIFIRPLFQRTAFLIIGYLAHGQVYAHTNDRVWVRRSVRGRLYSREFCISLEIK